MKAFTGIVSFFTFLLAVVGCIDKIDSPSNPDSENPTGEYFDFSTTNKYNLNVKYDVPEGYQVYFEVYEENPIIINANGQYEKKNIEPVEKGFTDTKGVFNQKITIPAAIQNFYVYSSYIGVPAVLQANVNGQSIEATPADEVSFDTKSMTRAGGNHLNIANGFKSLGEWAENGRPAYLAADKIAVEGSLLTKINGAFNEGQPVSEEFFEQTDIHIIEDAEIKLAFVAEGTANKNVLGYFCYETTNPPKVVEDIQDKIIAFPNPKETTLRVGEYVQLYYWKDGQNAGKIFPKGTSVGWVLCSNGYNYNGLAGVSNGNGAVFYSLPELNTMEPEGRKNHVALFKTKDEKGKDFIVFGFEDWYNVDGKGGDRDCNDVVFHVESNPIDAITGKIPEVEEPDLNPKKISYTKRYAGTLVFEDLWPNKGDYDMNDVVIGYRSAVHFNRFNTVLACVDTFTLLSNSAASQNGFGFQLSGIASDALFSTTTDGIGHTGKLGLVSKSGDAIFVIIENMKVAQIDHVVMNSIEFLDGIPLDRAPIPPYNPFIMVQTIPGIPIKYTTEVHLPNYKPTGTDGDWVGQNMDLFKTKDDRSNPEKGIYYVSDEKYPFAIHIPGDCTYVIPTEKVHISEFYPNFDAWAFSNGEKNKDWYRYPRK